MNKIIPISFKIHYIDKDNALMMFYEKPLRILISYVNKNEINNIKVYGEIFSIWQNDIRDFHFQIMHKTMNCICMKKIGKFIVKFRLTKTLIGGEIKIDIEPISIQRKTMGGLIKLWIFKRTK